MYIHGWIGYRQDSHSGRHALSEAKLYGMLMQVLFKSVQDGMFEGVREDWCDDNATIMICA